MHRIADICIVMHMVEPPAPDDRRGRRCHRVRRRRGAAPAARPSCRAHRRRHGRAPAPASRWGCSSHTSCPLAERVVEPTTPQTLAGHDAVVLALPHGQSAAIADALGDDTVVIDCGADFRLTDAATWERFYGGAHAGSWPYGLPELPGPARRAARRAPDRRPRLLPDRLDAGAGAGGRGRPRRPRRRRRRGQRHERRRQGGQAAPARQRGDGQRCRRTASAAPTGTRPRSPRTCPPSPTSRCGSASRRCWCRRRAGSWPPARRRLRDGVTAEDAHAAYQKAYADEPFVHVLPPGQWPQTQSVTGSNAVHLQVTVDRAAGRLVAVGAIDNLAKGTAGAAVQCLNLALGPRRDPGPEQRGARAVSVTTPRGFRAAGVAAGLKSTGGQDVALVVNDGPDLRLRERLHRQPLQGQPGAVEPAGRPGRRRARRRPQLRRRQLLHRPRRLPDHPRGRRARRGARSASAPSTSWSAPPA